MRMMYKCKDGWFEECTDERKNLKPHDASPGGFYGPARDLEMPPGVKNISKEG